MNKKESMELILEIFGDKDGDINLSNLDFGDKIINLNGLKAKRINNHYQEAKSISNYCQKEKK